ncbi:hypothetical protein M3Y98_00055700 [Aphelenchoides besseyi]|nr:hypothetical protein M3Y98_00055700 [Aphelenchoides besseyi]
MLFSMDMALTKNECLCGVHVHSGTLIVAIVWICLSLLQFALAFVPKEYRTLTSTYHVDPENNNQILVYSNYASENMPNINILKIIGTLVSIVFGVLLIIGVTHKIRIGYYPFLVWIALTSALLALSILLLAFFILMTAIVLILSGKASVVFLFYIVAVFFIFALFVLLLWAQVYFFFIVPKRSLDLLIEEPTTRVNDVQEKLTVGDPNYV